MSGRLPGNPNPPSNSNVVCHHRRRKHTPQTARKAAEQPKQQALCHDTTHKALCICQAAKQTTTFCRHLHLGKRSFFKQPCTTAGAAHQVARMCRLASTAEPAYTLLRDGCVQPVSHVHKGVCVCLNSHSTCPARLCPPVARSLQRSLFHCHSLLRRRQPEARLPTQVHANVIFAGMGCSLCMHHDIMPARPLWSLQAGCCCSSRRWAWHRQHGNGGGGGQEGQSVHCRQHTAHLSCLTASGLV